MPGLRFSYGTYATPMGRARPSGLSVSVREQNGFPISHVWSLTCEVILLADGAANLTAAALALSNALSVPYQSGGIQFTLDDVNWFNTHHWVNNAGSAQGVQPTQFAFPASNLQYATEQVVTVTLQAEYTNAGLAISTLRWEESVDIQGEGGAVTVLRPRWNAASILQEVKPFSDIVVVQSGTIVGRTAYPALPSPLIATAGARLQPATRDRKRPVQAGVYPVEFQRSYSYTFNLPTHPGTINPNVLV